MKEQPFISTSLERGDSPRLMVDELTFLENGPYSFSVEKGKTLGLSGESGIGKTQLLRAVADTIPHGGVVSLSGIKACDIPAPLWRTKVALVPAESVWWFDTVGEHFPADANLFIQEWIEKLGFSEDVFGWRVSRLSTGEKQRLALSRTMANRPEVLLLDEPSSALDGHHTVQLEKALLLHQRQYGTSMVWVSHDHEQLKRVSDTAKSVNRSSLQSMNLY